MEEARMKMEQTMLDLAAIQQDTEASDVNVFRPDDISPGQKDLIRQHLIWLGSIQKEYPMPATPYRIGVYIRYFNQTKYQNYLEYHKKQFEDTIALCPRWTLVDFYVDHGASAPNMENAPEWCRLLDDCFAGKVNLIITQKVSNISRKAFDLTLMIRILASQSVGIYFISEDIFTMASYYRHDMLDTGFFPESRNDPKIKPENENTAMIPGGRHVE